MHECGARQGVLVVFVSFVVFVFRDGRPPYSPSTALAMMLRWISLVPA